MNDLSAVADDDERINAFPASLTLKEKLGQMWQPDWACFANHRSGSINMQAFAAHTAGPGGRPARRPNR